MRVKLIADIKKDKQLTSYGLAKALRELGIPMTVQGIDAYEKQAPKSMRFDVLVGLKIISGYSWSKIGAYMEADYSPKYELR